MGLTLKQEKFCLEYLKCGNATKAATIVGYSAKTSYSIGNENLKKPEIIKRLEELKANLAETCGINSVMIVNVLKSIILSNISDIRSGYYTMKEFKKLPDEVKAAISEMHHEKRNGVNSVKIKMHSKLSAIEELNKMLGYNAPQKHEITGKNGKPLQQEVKHVVEFNDYAGN